MYRVTQILLILHLVNYKSDPFTIRKLEEYTVIQNLKKQTKKFYAIKYY